VRLFRVGLKPSTHTNTKHDIGPRCGKIKKRTDHRMVKLLVNRFTSLILVEMSIGRHWSLDRLTIIHLELPEDIISVLLLMNESPFLQLLDLKPKEEVELSDH
jgi:hypothetical protein